MSLQKERKAKAIDMQSNFLVQQPLVGLSSALCKVIAEEAAYQLSMKQKTNFTTDIL